jgi:hypothetical protein
MASTIHCLKTENPLTKDRLTLLTRIYHSAAYAGEATGIAPNSLTRAASRFGLKFRMKLEPRDIQALAE